MPTARPVNSRDEGFVPVSTEAVWKHAQAKDAQNGFLNCLLPTEVASAIGFRIDEIETEILHAS